MTKAKNLRVSNIEQDFKQKNRMRKLKEWEEAGGGGGGRGGGERKRKKRVEEEEEEVEWEEGGKICRKEKKREAGPKLGLS